MIAPPILWTIWFGSDIDKSTTHGPRALHLSRLNNADVLHRHITETNLHTVNVSSSPIHPQILLPYMSGIHKSDYMRSYLMYHYGGAYADIKPNAIVKWAPFFKEFKDTAWVYGARERSANGVACNPNKLNRLNVLISCNEMRRRYKQMITNGAYIFKAHTPFALDWLTENNKRLDELTSTLKKHPSPVAGRCCQFKDPNGYPLNWAELHGEIFHPLTIKYKDWLQISTNGFHF